MPEELPEHGITPSMVAAGTTMPEQHVIDAAVHTVRSLCGWHVWPVREETVTVDTTGDDVVFLPTKRLHNVTEVSIDNEQIPPGEWSFSADGMLQLTRRPPAGFRRLAATITHGYDEVPDLAGVIGQMARRAGAPQESYQVGGISVGAPGAVTPQSTEWRIVDLYKLGPMP
ncbi:hypothetical protein [Corynebacterium doosanense]|uniref:Head-to-tail adaptor n=1 Tax=Corynebacterium doosanense CAU 212 = DSM 45436 TaxID=558173 RepID=A0A097IDE2_9CORY|nr:hypothetical protein [Corynebacterium doosanense]AIT60163.1 hypothetical protein CDOO_01950 [Corynebacterium doosanense CAU 212 = DSM 45436]